MALYCRQTVMPNYIAVAITLAGTGSRVQADRVMHFPSQLRLCFE
jgi:hypothetical protein